MTSLRVRFSELDVAGQSLRFVGDDLQSVIGSLAPVLDDGVAGSGADPAGAALAMFGQALTNVVTALASGFGEIGDITAAASNLYESTDDSVFGGG